MLRRQSCNHKLPAALGSCSLQPLQRTWSWHAVQQTPQQRELHPPWLRHLVLSLPQRNLMTPPVSLLACQSLVPSHKHPPCQRSTPLRCPFCRSLASGCINGWPPCCSCAHAANSACRRMPQP